LILLFTSVPKERTFYKRDVLNACCEPSGAKLQLAYKTKWIAEPLRSGDRFTDKQALIIFSEKLPNESGYDRNFHPLRLGRIDRVQPDHESLTFTLTLEKFFDVVKYASDPNFAEHFKQWITKNDDHPAQDRKRARFVREDDEQYAAGTDKWQPLAEYIANVEGLNDSAFCNVAIWRVRGKDHVLHPKYDSGHPEYGIESGTELKVTAQIVYGKKAVRNPPTLELSNSVGAVVGPLLGQRSSGVEASFFVRLKRVLEADEGMLVLRVPPESGREVVSSETSAMIRVTASRRLLWCIVGAIALGTPAAGFTTEQAEAVASAIGSTWFIAHADTVLFWCVKVAGIAAIGWGARAGFGKLPIKG